MTLSKASKSSIACSGLSKITKPIDYKDPIFAKLFARILARDGNGAGPKDGVFTPAPHDFDLPYPHLALHDRQNFLSRTCPSGCSEAPSCLIKLYFLLIYPQLLQLFLIKPASLIKIYLKL